MKRRTFLSAGAALAAPVSAAVARRPPIDFRYAPLQSQATFCFPDDVHKSLVGERGDLRYGYDRRRKIQYFPYTVEFSLRGMDQDRVVLQKLESPSVPIVHTRIERPEAWLELTTFATNLAAEGRVDNVILEVRPKSARQALASPVLRLRTRQTATVNNRTEVMLQGMSTPFLVADHPLRATDVGDGYVFAMPEAFAQAGKPLVCFVRFPQEGQEAERIAAGLRRPYPLLEEARAYWRDWAPFQSGVTWHLPGPYQDFLLACTRNILQAREMVNGHLSFQVGPTTYRGLWVVDGNFILEAARYLGYDEEVQQGLETTWSMQRDDGSVVAAVETAHWKDTGIAMFSMVRQAELGQDWSYFRKMWPNVLRGVAFLDRLREQARAEGSVNGRYGLLAKGFGDGGIGGGLRDEFTNTLWALAGLRAVSESARAQKIAGYEPAAVLYENLSRAFFDAARQQMRRHPAGFDFLPMILKEDPLWEDIDSLQRTPFQQGQWALAQALFPGLVFDRNDAVTKGYVALMQAITQEDVPVETGWLPHEGLWNYDACFAAHACLWAGAREFALSTFRGFLNHATPLYCWREEQPLRNALTGGYVGDMPHNWASAECILFLRHMLVLEDAGRLRLLEGIDEEEMTPREPFAVTNTPTRFGRVSVSLEPRHSNAWTLKFRRPVGPVPSTVQLPERLGGRPFADLKGAHLTRDGGYVLVDPQSTEWEATWKS